MSGKSTTDAADGGRNLPHCSDWDVGLLGVLCHAACNSPGYVPVAFRAALTCMPPHKCASRATGQGTSIEAEIAAAMAHRRDWKAGSARGTMHAASNSRGE